MLGKRILFILIVTGAALAAFIPMTSGCRREKELRASVPTPANSYKIDKIDRISQISSQEKLRILSATPLGRTASPHEAETVVVIFDRPMVALQELAEATAPPSPPAKLETHDRSLLQFDPPKDGRYRWVGTRTLAFTPAKRFPYATEIKATVPAGLTSLDGSPLAEDFSWTFKTIEPRLIRHYPTDGQRWLRLDTEVLLIFNQPMDKEKASGFISWVVSPSESSNQDAPKSSPRPRGLAFEISHPAQDRLKAEGLDLSAEHALLLTLSRDEKLSLGTTCFITLKKGLPAREGTLGLENEYSFFFETFGPFRFEGLEQPRSEQAPATRTKIKPLATSPPASAVQPFLPSEPLPFKFTNQVYYKEFVTHIEFDPPVEIPEYYSEWDYASNVLYLSLPLEPETTYTVRISADLTDEFGNKLGKPVSLKFQTSSFPPSISMTTGHGVIEAYAFPAPTYPLQAINQKDVTIQAVRLSRETLIPLLSQPKIFWSNEKYFGPPGFFQLEKTIPLRLPRNKRRTVPIDLSPLFPPSSRYGLVFLQVDTNRPEQKWDRYLKVFLQITELGISAKFSAENNIIWVTELKTGQPVPGASLEIRDDSNAVKWRGETDSSGKAETPGWKKLGLVGSRDAYSEPRLWVFAQRGSDTAFTSSEWGTGLDPYRFRIAYDWYPEPALFEGYIFTERGIYRAGEDVHIKGIIREKIKGEWHIPGDGTTSVSLDCEIRDPFDKVVYQGKHALDEYGSFNFDFTPSPDASLGTYSVTAKLPSRRTGSGAKEPEALFSGTFRVEAFRPAEFEVHLRAASESFVFGRDYEAEIRANYLFGGAMAGQEVGWYLRLNRTSFSPPGHPGYVFGNELEWGEEEIEPASSRLLASATGVKLDAQGKLNLKVPLVAEKEKDSVLATLEATVTSPSRKSISNRIQSLVHRGDFYVGLKPSTSFLKKGDPLTVEVIAASPDGSLVSGRKIALKLVRREWRSVRQAGVGGRFRWQTEKEDIEVEGRNLQTESTPVSVTFKPEKSGFYFLLASATDERKNPVTTTTSFYVTGRDYVPWERSDDDAIELVADASSYRPGESARILVKSPYERAKALVTIEREFILEAKVIDIEGTASSLDIPVRSEYIPNVFVSVLLVHGRSEPTAGPDRSATATPALAAGSPGEEISMPSFKIGYINLPVDPAEKRLSVAVENVKPEYKPREKVTLNFKVKKADGSPANHTSLAVAVVDVGVLNLIGYETPDPFSAFYGERPLSVRTSETRLHVVEQREYGEKGEEPGGGGLLREMAAPFGLGEVELRGDFKSTAYWNPALPTDEKGEASVTFTLPDNLTTFRVMAVAQTRDSRFGRAESAFRVSKKLLLQPSLPRFLRVGDTIEAGVVVHNYSGAKGNVTLTVEASGVRLLDKRKETRISLKTGESREALFAFKAEEPGRASFAFRGRMGSETDGLELGLPVLLPRPTETVALSGEVGENQTLIEERIRIPANVYAEESRLDVEAASTALVGLKGSLEFLADYPYACLEQRLSALLPYIVARRVLIDFKLTSLSQTEIDNLVRKRLNEVAGFQKDNGGFSAWPDSTLISPFLTCYAAFTLIQAREAGFHVSAEILDRASDYLIRFLRTGWREGGLPYGQRAWKTTRAYALYVLSLLGKYQPALADGLYAEKDTLSLFGSTLLLKALHHGHASPTARATLLQELLNKVKVTPSEAHFEDDEGRDGRWIYSSNGRTTALILQTLIEIGEDHPLLAPVARWLINRQRETAGGRFASTQESFYLFYALNAFYERREKMAADFTAQISLAGRTLLEERFTPESREVKGQRLRLVEIERPRPGQSAVPQEARELPLQIKKKGSGTLYYGARLTYAPLRPAAARDEGIAVVKRIEPLDRLEERSAQAPAGVRAGSLVVVTIEVAVPQESLYVVINDPLPAGFEAVNPSFITESEEAARRLEEVIRAYQPESARWWSGFNHIEMHDDRVLLFADSLSPGLHTHRYLARALNFGAYVLPGTRAEQMYAPEVFGRSQEALVKVIR